MACYRVNFTFTFNHFHHITLYNTKQTSPCLHFSDHLKEKWYRTLLCFKLSPCCSDDSNSSGYFPGVWLLLKVRRFGTLYRLHLQHRLKMEPIQGSETSAINNNQTPGKYPEELLLPYCFVSPFKVHQQSDSMQQKRALSIRP